jgi:hypothetical protein
MEKHADQSPDQTGKFCIVGVSYSCLVVAALPTSKEEQQKEYANGLPGFDPRWGRIFR